MRRYLLPERVVTIPPDFAAPRTGDVVMRAPLRKFLELLTFPEMLPSLFFCQFDKTGISSAGAVFGAAELFPKLPKEKDGDDFFAVGAVGAGFFTTFLVA
jgi:hypothetical protein